MKKIFNLAVAAFAAVMIISCDKNGEDITVSTVEVSNVDLWANTATLSFGDVTPDAVSYRVKGTETWFDAESVDGVFTIAPVWNESKNDAGLTVYTVEEGTGIFAGKTYEFQVNGETLADADYTSAAGDVIPNGDMSGWSEYENGLTEYEFDHVFVCQYSGVVNPAETEIDEIRWVEITKLKRDVIINPQNYASWFLIALPRLLELVGS